MQLIDSHCHLDFEQFSSSRNQVVTEAQQAGVIAVVVPGVESAYWQRQLALKKSTANIHLAFGLHPYFLSRFQASDLALLEEYIQYEDCLAIGECGIDLTIGNIELQQQVFVEQIKLANKYQLPLIVHHRKSHHVIFEVFKQYKPQFGGVIHAFSGSLQDANKYIQLGFKLGCGGTITYSRAVKTRAVFTEIDLQHIVLETDAPNMPLFGHQGAVNAPKQVTLVAQCLAELKSTSVALVAEQTSLNCANLFAINFWQ